MITDILITFIAWAVLGIATSAEIACNNSPDLCSRSYGSITHLGAHDSPFVRDASTGDSISANQYYNSTLQLSAGVRLLSAQVHKNNNDWHLCHTSCDLLDAGLLSDWLKQIKIWLDENPNDVVTILLVNSDSASATQLDAEFQTASIANYAYKPPSTTSPIASGEWPTLQALITAKTRLLVFVASLDPTSTTSAQSYLMDEFTFIFENPYDNTSPGNFSCLANRPTALQGQTTAAIASNRLPFMNHFLYTVGALDIETPNTDNITFTNSPKTAAVGQLGNSLATCKAAYGDRAPTFVLVDFFDQGPAIQAVDNINGITATGRTALPSPNAGSDTSRSEASFQSIKALVEKVNGGEEVTLANWIYASGDWMWGGLNLAGGNVLS